LILGRGETVVHINLISSFFGVVHTAFGGCKPMGKRQLINFIMKWRKPEYSHLSFGQLKG
jgi:hypothetical protein